MDTTASSPEVVLQAQNIVKRFPGVLANDRTNLTLHRGEILALLGENGAGKSTLMNIIYGLYHADEGTISVKGAPVRLASPREAIQRGIGMVHQHFQLIPVMNVAENVVLGAEETVAGTLLNRQRAAQRVHELSQQFGLEVNPDALVENLPVGIQQRVEIIKALYRHADILILDEPTAVLTPQESRELFRIMKDLAAQGVSMIFITHKLKEVFAVADSIVVMRGGKVVGTTTPKEATESSLAAMMVGREVILRVSKQDAQPGDVVLSVTDLHAKTERGAVAIDRVSFDVHAGEILGVAGVQGNGQTELVEVLTGLRRPTSGQIRLLNKRITTASAREITMIGTGHIPEDRQRHGMVKPFSVADNLILNQYYNSPFSSAPSWQQLPLALVAYIVIFGGLTLLGSQVWSNILWSTIKGMLNLTEVDTLKNSAPYLIALAITLLYIVGAAALFHIITSALLKRVFDGLKAVSGNKYQGGLTVDDQAVNDNARQLIEEFDIRTPTIRTHAGTLSGGNQQKMIVAREFSRKPRLLIASQPTRGIDVGSIEFIHQRIIQQRDAGAAVLLVSAELDEITALSDRIAVMYKGRIMDIVDARTATREQLGLLMAGVMPDTDNTTRATA